MDMYTYLFLLKCTTQSILRTLIKHSGSGTGPAIRDTQRVQILVTSFGHSQNLVTMDGVRGKNLNNPPSHPPKTSRGFPNWVAVYNTSVPQYGIIIGLALTSAALTEVNCYNGISIPTASKCIVPLFGT